MEAKDELEMMPCSFKFHNFEDSIGESSIVCHIMKMEKSLYVWVANSSDQCMKDLALGFATNKNIKIPPIATKIMGPIVDETSNSIALRLSKKIGTPVYVSFNVNADNLSLPGIERRIYQEFKDHPELLDF